MSGLYSFIKIMLVTGETSTRETLSYFSKLSPLMFIECSGQFVLVVVSNFMQGSYKFPFEVIHHVKQPSLESQRLF